MSNQRVGFSQTKTFKVITNFFYALQFPKAILHLYLFFTSPDKHVIEKDIERWIEIEHIERVEEKRPTWMELVWLIWKHEHYRNLFYYRIKWEFRVSSRVVLEIAKLIYKERNTLFIKADYIGEGFFIQHGYATGIGAKSIGKNCWVNQQVVIGFSDIDKAPVLGDNVQVAVGAKVLGDVTIGDNSIVGANAVVVKNIPPNCTVVGVPAYIIKRDGKKVKEAL